MYSLRRAISVRGVPRAATWLAGAALALGGCGGDGGDGDPDARPTPPGGVTATFAPPAPGAGADWGAIPYPSDLFLDSDGYLTLTSVPFGPNHNEMAATMLREALHTMDGAALGSHVYFPVSGDVDTATLDGNVFLIDLETGDALDVDLHYRSEIGAIQAMPVRGTALRENHSYGAYVTSAVLDTRGRPLAPAAAFAEAIDLTATPGDAAVASAQAVLRPLIESLDADTVASLAVATVFRTHNATEGFRDMFAVVEDIVPALTDDALEVFGPDQSELDIPFGGPVPPDAPSGFDDTDPRGEPHGNVGALIHGYFTLPSFLAADPQAAGFMTRDGAGEPQIKGMHRVKFTLILPRPETVGGSYADLPVLIYTHGIERNRADMLAPADYAAKEGYAYFGIDMLFHGDRQPNVVDERWDTNDDSCGANAEYCDGFGDRRNLIPAANFFHLVSSGGVPAYHPQSMMENMRQNAVDTVSVINFLDQGDLAKINTALDGAGLPGDLSFRGDEIGILTESFGAMPTIIAGAVDVRIKIAFLASPASEFPYPLLYHSAANANDWINVFLSPADVTDRFDDADPDRNGLHEPVLMLYNSAIEQGDSLAFAPHLLTGTYRGDPGINLIVTQTWQDEWVPNSSVEHLVGVMDLPMMQISRPMEPPGPKFRFVPGHQEVAGPITGNAAGGQRTAVATLWYPAAHALLRKLEDLYEYEPIFPPFVLRDETWFFCNPVWGMHRFWSTFFNQYFKDGNATPTVSDPFEGIGYLVPATPPCDV